MRISAANTEGVVDYYLPQQAYVQSMLLLKCRHRRRNWRRNLAHASFEEYYVIASPKYSKTIEQIYDFSSENQQDYKTERQSIIYTYYWIIIAGFGVLLRTQKLGMTPLTGEEGKRDIVCKLNWAISLQSGMYIKAVFSLANMGEIHC